MLDTLEPAEPERPPAPKFIDAAKALRQRIEHADLYHSATTNVLLEPAMERFRRYPGRKLRQDMLGTIAREWLRMNSEFRLSLKSELSKGRLTIREIRLQAGNLRRHDGPDAESDVAAQEVIVTLDGSRGWLQSRCICCWSLFALAWRLAHPPCSDTDLLEDCALVVDATTSGTIVPGADFKVVTDPATGASWCGRGLLGQDAQGKKLPALVIRTWRCGDA